MESRLLDQLLEYDVPWCLSVRDKDIWADASSFSAKDIKLVIQKQDGWEVAVDDLHSLKHIDVQVAHETGVYVLRLKRRKVEFEEERVTMIARVTSDLEHVQRREAFRVRVLLDTKIRTSVGFGSVHEALIRDLSETGARITFSGPVELGPEKSEITLMFNSDELGNMALKAQIRWKNEQARKCDLGVRFIAVPEQDAARLLKYVSEIQRNRAGR